MTSPERALGPLAAPEARTTSDRIFETLHAAVVSLRLPPGTKVSEADIARQLEVSRQPVRDAFHRLSKLGFLSIRPQRATLVTKISERAVIDAMFVRTAIEVECLRVIARRPAEADIARLRSILQAQLDAMADPDRERFHALDDVFHRSLCEIAGHPHAWELIREQKAHMDRVRYLTLSAVRRRTVANEHAAIVDAVERADPAAAEARLREHLHDIRDALTAQRREHADYFAEPT